VIDLVSLAAIVRKEFIQALRDRRMLAMLLGIPVLQIIIFGFAANLEFNRADTVFVDEDRSEESRDFLRGLTAEKTFLAHGVVTVAEMERELRNGTSQVGVVVPRGFGRRVEGVEAATVQAFVDGSDPTRAVAATAALEQYASRRTLEALRGLGGVAGVARVTFEPRLLYNPSLKSRLFMVPGTAASILVILTTIVTAMGLAREREVGTMEQLLVTPIRPLTLMVGKTIPYAVFGLVDVTLILVVGNLVFDVPMRGGVAVVYLGALVYLVSTLGVGLLIATVVETQQQALMVGFFFLLPAILLSGFMTPIEAMPRWIVPLTYLNPVRYFVAILRAVLLRGAGLRDVAEPMGSLAALSLGVLLLSAARFRRTLG
jgi:ABC-2 type transport system permease protein